MQQAHTCLADHALEMFKIRLSCKIQQDQGVDSGTCGCEK